MNDLAKHLIPVIMLACCTFCAGSASIAGNTLALMGWLTALVLQITIIYMRDNKGN